MRYNDTIDDSRQYLRMALELIGKYKLPTDPLNYCIWYEYSSGRNPELNSAVDSYLEASSRFSTEINQQIFDQYIAGRTQNLNNLVGEELKKAFFEIIGAIKTTKQHLSVSENNLETINETLLSNLSEAGVEAIVNKIKNEISMLESSSTSFKAQLQQATREIDQLKTKMAHYRDEAIKDPLTKIDNRRGFEKKLKKTLDTCNADGNSLCLIMADIDHFKKVNDTHGHLVGDNVLRVVAATIKESIKGKDLVARIGGEEFAILLPDTPFDGAMKLAENMRLTFEGLDLKKKNTGEGLGKITLSFGVTISKPDEAAENLMQRADAALYQSKRTGRNKVTGL